MIIGKKAVDDGGVTLIEDLREFAKYLKKEMQMAKDRRIRADLELMIQKILQFVTEYQNALNQNLFSGYNGRVNSFIIFIKKTMEQTILRDFKDKIEKLKVIEEAIRRGQV